MMAYNRRACFTKWSRAFGCLLALGLAAQTFAEAQTSSLSGTLRNPEGGPVVEAEIFLIDAANGASRTADTDRRGVYVFAQLPPGVYTLIASVPPLRPLKVEGLHLRVDTPVTLDLQLEIGGRTETVINVGGRFLPHADASLGNEFGESQITELPLEFRDVFQLMTLQPGVTPSGFGTGSRSDLFDVTLDGVDINNREHGAQKYLLRLAPDAVQQFRSTVHNASAAQGRSSGPQVALITKSGTNQAHGSLFYFHRNTATAANDFFNNRVIDPSGRPNPLPRPAVLRHQYGATLGGPVNEDRTFVFFNYEGRKDRRQESLVREIPLAGLGQGVVLYRNLSGDLVTLTPEMINGLYPAGINPRALAVLADAAEKYPANDTTVGDGLNTGGYRFNAHLPSDFNASILRIDHLAGEHHQMFLRLNHQEDNSALAPRFPDTPSPAVWSHPIGILIQHAWSLTNSQQNTLRYGMTRQSYTVYGDSAENAALFRSVYQPFHFSRTLSRVTPVHNFADDFSWTRGRHHFQFGANVRLISSQTSSLDGTFDVAEVSPDAYATEGTSLTNPVPDVDSGSAHGFQSAMAAVLGRWSHYSANYSFGRDGALLPVGTQRARRFRTEGYEFYGQDSWRAHPTLNLTGGVRWTLNTPVYEGDGFQIMPTTSLQDFFERRTAASRAGEAVNELIEADAAGRWRNRPGWYEKEWKNFAPRGALAWSPNFSGGILKALLGENKTVIRAGFGVSYENLGSALLAVADQANGLGYSSSWTLAGNTFNAGGRPGPLFDGFSPDVRSFPEVSLPSGLSFPFVPPADGLMNSASAFDDGLRSPIHYTWNVSYARDLGVGLHLQAAYLGRSARHLLAQRDLMTANNITDPQSGMDWYTAARILAEHRLNGTPVSDVPDLAFFNNLFPAYGTADLTPTQRVYRWIAGVEAGGRNDPDWTYIQAVLNESGIVPGLFYHPQWASLWAWSSVAESDYHAFAFTARERFRDQLTLDFNYTLSKSIDNASSFVTADQDSWAFIINSLRPEDMRAVSDFDLKHIINVNWVWDFPFGRGRTFWGGMSGLPQAILGGWKVSGLMRWNSGLPTGRTVDMSGWATNWRVRSANVRLRDIQASPTKHGGDPNLFSDPEYAYQSFRSPFAGETGDRNIWRLQSYTALDLGLHKLFPIPRSESQEIVLRWEIFNLTNTQRLGASPFLEMGLDPFLNQPAADFGRISSIQGSPRVMQMGLRYQF
jgi:hypothetical protein